MSLLWRHHAQARIARDGSVRRRDFLRAATAGGVGLAAMGGLGFEGLATLKADEAKRRKRSCILLFMQGAPSQFETFDPKPGHANGGETKAIATSIPGVQIAENLPKLAQQMHRVSLLRSLSTKEGNHQRAVYLMHTGYLPTASVKHPTFGSVAVQQMPRADGADLPSFVRVGGRQLSGAGFLGVEYDPFNLNSAQAPPSNTRITTGEDRFHARLDLLGRLERPYAERGAAALVEEQQKLYAQAAQLVTSAEMKAFDLSQEPDSVRAKYGSGEFASGCLLARRLVESGVGFIEVVHGNWDTHFDNFDRTKDLCGQIDQPAAALLEDLAERGLLDSTLVLWVGEFGRTPKINPRGGRDHFPGAFCGWMAGAGVRGGQVIGSTTAGGDRVAERPISEKDLLQTVCKALQLDASVENMSPIGRPIRIVDGGTPVEEAFG